MSTTRAQTEVDVANLALVNYLGEQPIGALTDKLHRARVIASVFGTARDAALRSDDWNFATAWIKPAQLSQTAIGPLQLRFPMPDDCLRVRDLYDATFLDTSTPPADPTPLPQEMWDIEAANVNPNDTASANMVVVTNVATPLVCYTRRIVQPVLWDADFVKVFAEVLAGMAAAPITKDPSRAADMRARADEKLDDAAMENAREGAPRHVSRYTSWTEARQVGIARRPAYRDTGY